MFSSLALFIRTQCFALLAPSLSFRSSYAPAFLVLFLFIRCRYLYSSSGFWYCFPDVVRSFPFLLSLGLCLFDYLWLCVSLSVSSAFSVRFSSSFFVASGLPNPLQLLWLFFICLWFFLFCPLLFYQSGLSRLRIFFSVSDLLVRSFSLSVLLSPVTLCGCLLSFLPLLVSSASHCRCLGREPPSLLFGVAFCVFCRPFAVFIPSHGVTVS